MRKRISTQQKLHGALKGTTELNIDRFAKKLASCNRTSFAGRFMRDFGSVLNPATIADRYSSVDDFRHDYQLYNVVRKYNGSCNGTAETRRMRAFEQFRSVDSSLSQINHDLNWTNLGLKNPVACNVLFRAARKIERLLGVLDLDEVYAGSSFSHGATMLHSRKEGRAPFKFSFENPEVTRECASLAWAMIQSSPAWSETVKSLTLVRGNRLTTVPKDADIDRVIACEPLMNMYVQKGIGSVLRRRLKRVNINLDDQTVNQRLAKAGSLDGSLATVDLSAASDSISLAICKLLLPLEWFHLLLMTRSDVGEYPDGTQICYEKISSMGNGFTFELESLLFWSITQACEDLVADSYGEVTYRCSVYGDDIICRTRTFALLQSTLELCGFHLNTEKSYSMGPFRESCGKHYFNGIDVSPFFVRGPVKSVLDLVGLCNRLRRWNRLCIGIDDPRYVDLYNWLKSFLPPYWQKAYIPDGLGDGALYGCLDEVKPNFGKSGVYKAPVLVISERTVTEKQSRFVPLAEVFFGKGGYTTFLRDLLARDYFNTRGSGPNWSRASYEDKTSSSCGNSFEFAVLTEPGELLLQKQHVCITEWSDLVEGSLVA